MDQPCDASPQETATALAALRQVAYSLRLMRRNAGKNSGWRWSFGWVAWLLLILVPGPAAAVERHSHADPGADYAAFHTFAWMTRPLEVPDHERRTPILDELLRRTVAEGLESRGLQKVPEDQADLLFIYYVDPRRNLALYSRDYVTSDMADWLRPLKGFKNAKSVVVIDGISRDHGRLVWRGIFAMKLAEPWTLARKIRRVTSKLVRNIPFPER